MPFFADSDQLYAVAGTLLTRVQEEEPEATAGISNSRLVIRLETSEPTTEFTLNGRQRPVEITYGPSRLRPTLDIELAADTLHRILSGEQSMKRALANGLLKVQGPVWRVTALADLFHWGQTVYPEVLREQGLSSNQ
jgi:putative sterol carrier protein